ncbi:hypothetical protein [Paenibacillus eucommiae]|uniref:Uncharacterized protein n=1 Tax=Paenibacillus eucommiae TaxID=1355755 RepID=A0ABS4J8R6_9BACL|nr:hypothetical protein [Paenibacillus eucommiae]MBP1996234.1 hypothetical protein [Paenibacillus eucommiae]
MGANIKVYCLYKIYDKYYLLRVSRPEYSNVNQMQEDIASEMLEVKKKALLNKIFDYYHLKDDTNIEFIGELQGYPIGNDLYVEKGFFSLTLFYCQTDYGFPWIVIGHSESKHLFLEELMEDEDLSALRPIGDPREVNAMFFIEEDFL